MANISDDDTGSVSFTLTVLSQAPKQGLIDDGPVGMNSNLGLVKLIFRIALDDQPWLDADIMVFTEALYSWISSAERLVQQGAKGDRTGFDNQICPHLRLDLWRNEWVTYEGEEKEVHNVNYDFFAGLASQYLLQKGGDWGMAPGMWMELMPIQLTNFLAELRTELDEVAAGPAPLS
jgi:hypothetical protein